MHVMAPPMNQLISCLRPSMVAGLILSNLCGCTTYRFANIVQLQPASRVLSVLTSVARDGLVSAYNAPVSSVGTVVFTDDVNGKVVTKLSLDRDERSHPIFTSIQRIVFEGFLPHGSDDLVEDNSWQAVLEYQHILGRDSVIWLRIIEDFAYAIELINPKKTAERIADVRNRISRSDTGRKIQATVIVGFTSWTFEWREYWPLAEGEPILNGSSAIRIGESPLIFAPGASTRLERWVSWKRNDEQSVGSQY